MALLTGPFRQSLLPEGRNLMTENVAQETAVRTWRVSADLYAPMASPVTPLGVGTQLRFTSRFVPRMVVYPQMTVALRQSIGPREGMPALPPGWERLVLVADFSCTGDASEALKPVVSLFETILDPLAFELGTTVHLGQCEILDITAPAAIDDDRELMIFASIPFGRNVRSVDMECIRGAVTTTLPDAVPDYDAKTSAALRWFNKSLSTDLLHDQFIFLWIALEILCDLSSISVQAPYQAKCGHLIPQCPECDATTVREVRGQTIMRFLTSEFGVNKETAKSLWGMRQMMHGAINFDSSKLENLPRLVQPLRAAVAAGIKKSLGKNPGDVPLVAPAGLSIHPSLGLGGTRKLRADDLRPLTLTE
jgi:hypothetical protein